MTVEEQLADLRADLSEVISKVKTLDTFVKVTMAASSDLAKRVQKDEDWLITVSTLARHALDHIESMKATSTSVEPVPVEPVPVAKANKDSQAGIEIA